MMISRSVGRSSRDYVVAVVGGGSGIGAAAAKHIGELGASVFVIDEDATAAAATAAAVACTGARAGSAGADVCDLDSFQRAVDKAAGWNGRIDAVVNASVVHERSRLEDFEHASVSVLTAAVVVAHAVVPRMYEAGYGRIAHVTSIGDLALIGLVRSQGRELATTGISVNALIPAEGAVADATAMLTYLTSLQSMYPSGETFDFS